MKTRKIMIPLVIAILFWGCTDETPMGIDQLSIDDPDGIPPVLTNVYQTGDSVRVAWIDNITNESGFRIFRKVVNGNYTQIADVSPNTFDFTDKSILQDETTYFYYVETYGTGLSQSSNEKQITYSKMQGISVGFEDGQVPNGWSNWGYNGWYVTNESVYEGNYSIRCSSSYYNYEYLKATINVPQNTYINISFVHKGYNDGDGYFYINGGEYLHWGFDYYGNSWYSYQETYYTSSNTQITLQWQYSTESYGYGYLDNIQVNW